MKKSPLCVFTPLADSDPQKIIVGARVESRFLHKMVIIHSILVTIFKLDALTRLLEDDKLSVGVEMNMLSSVSIFLQIQSV